MTPPEKPASPSLPELAAELGALAEKYAAALSVAPRNEASDVADGVASVLHVLVDAFARTRLEVRALMHAAMGNVVLGELAACLDAKRPGSE